jgi:hypothetical protein
MFLAHSVFAYLVNLGYRIDPLGGGSFSVAAAQGIRSVHIFLVTFFLVILPFGHERTNLLSRYPKVAVFVAPPLLSVMNAPLTAINGYRWYSASTGFLLFAAVLIVGYRLVQALRSNQKGKLYLTTVLLLLVVGGYGGAVAIDPSRSLFKLFVMSSGFVLYALDLFERAGDS